MTRFAGYCRWSKRRVVVVLVAALAFAAAGPLRVERDCSAEDAQWIWSPEHAKDGVPIDACHFRKKFRLTRPSDGEITIAADDEYVLYVNGRTVGSGGSARRMDKHDIGRYLTRGTNLVAVKVSNTEGSTAALAARVMIKEYDGRWLSYSTDDSWKTSLGPLPLWNLGLYNDSNWAMAQSFGPLGSTEPWDRAATVAKEEQENHERFTIARDFRVQLALDDKQTGSLLAMTFNEFGQIIASREGGPLILITDTNDDQIPDTVTEYGDQVKSCQGILALNGEVFVTGDGPAGVALYRLNDKDRDGKLDDVRTLVKFTGEMGEHGVHGLTLGPDGLIYVVVGNHSGPVDGYDESSPHRDYYEGDIVGPRYEDPGGHAVGVKTPGGVVLRTDIEGDKVELVAGGLRNAYDLVFNREGDLFVHDSDMESDIGTSWYRPTQLFHIIPGGEYGWRSGWSKWPDYYLDSLPGTLDTGRGSPSGAVCYNHHMFPSRYHNALFLADWSEGRILAVRMKRNGASYTASSEVFLQGEPLNVTDLDVGPDGSLYFITGGRGTGGGLYRITWRGTVPEHIRTFSDDISRVIRSPQLHSAWGRQQLAALKIKLGEDWEKTLNGVARTTANPARYRTRALDLLQLFGPLPTQDTLIKLSKDTNEEVRAKAADLLGLHTADETRDALIALLDDTDAAVRRKAYESLVRAGQSAPVDKLLETLKSEDRFEAWAARRALERTPPDEWRESLLNTEHHRQFNQLATALLIAHADKEHGLDVLARVSEIMKGYVTDRDFIDLLRVAELAVIRGGIRPDEVAELREQFAKEFPSGNSTMNRELARLLAFMQITSIADRYLEYLKSPDVSHEDKVHLAVHLRFIESGWTTQQRLALLRFYQQARQWKGGGSYAHYVMSVARDFAKSLREEDFPLVMAGVTQWPDAALGVLYRLPNEIDEPLLERLKQMDRQLDGQEDDVAVKRLQVGVVALLARSGDEQSLAYLRDIWQRNPQRREAATVGLAQSPGGDNWEYLVRTLPILEGPMAREVLVRLAGVEQKPEDAESYRQVILAGLRLKEEGAEASIALLTHWAGKSVSAEDDSWEEALAKWQAWYGEEYPNGAEAKLPVASQETKWNYDELLEYLTGEEAAAGSAERGAAVFVKAQCIKCHRFGDAGESMGPDLTTISRRFTRKEILQSIIYPSHVISDQYASKTVMTKKGRQFTGIVAPGAAGEKLVLLPTAVKLLIRDNEIEKIVPSRISAMPDGLLESLSLEEVVDLFTYLGAAPKTDVVRRISDTEE